MSAARTLFDEQGTDIALDAVATVAGVANATLYRHFATRNELIVAVYTDEVDELQRLAAQLALDLAPGQALTDWLLAFAHHVATKRDLAMAIADDAAVDRGELFRRWHATMHDAAAALLARAQRAHAVRDDVTTGDLLAVVAGIALTGVPSTRLDALIDLVRVGYSARGS